MFNIARSITNKKDVLKYDSQACEAKANEIRMRSTLEIRLEARLRMHISLSSASFSQV